MKTLKTIILILILMIAYQSKAQVSIYNNFGPGHDGWDYNYGLGWTLAGDSIQAQYGVEQAMGFEATEGGFVTDIWVAISYVPSSYYADTVTIRLVENPDGLPPDPAYVLEEWTITSFSSWSQWNTPKHLVASNTTQIHAGSSYWLWAIATDKTWTMWCMNEDPALTCPHTIRREGEDWLSISNETASAFRVDVSTGVGIRTNDLNQTASLISNYPNPFSSSTSIAYEVEKEDHIRISINDMLGNEIRILTDEFQDKGDYTIKFNGEGMAPGIYFCILQSGSSTLDVIKLNLVK